MVIITSQTRFRPLGEKRVALHSLTWRAYQQIHLYQFLEHAQQDEIEAEKAFRQFANQQVGQQS